MLGIIILLALMVLEVIHRRGNCMNTVACRLVFLSLLCAGCAEYGYR